MAMSVGTSMPFFQPEAGQRRLGEPRAESTEPSSATERQESREQKASSSQSCPRWPQLPFGTSLVEKGQRLEEDPGILVPG